MNARATQTLIRSSEPKVSEWEREKPVSRAARIYRQFTPCTHRSWLIEQVQKQQVSTRFVWQSIPDHYTVVACVRVPYLIWSGESEWQYTVMVAKRESDRAHCIIVHNNRFSRDTERFGSGKVFVRGNDELNEAELIHWFPYFFFLRLGIPAIAIISSQFNNNRRFECTNLFPRRTITGRKYCLFGAKWKYHLWVVRVTHKFFSRQ